jgi:predicted transcriptional regulator
MIVTEDEFELERKKLEQKESIEISKIERGRGQGNNEVPAPMREIIAEDAILSGNGRLGELLGVSRQSINAYKNGSTSLATYNKKGRVTARDRIANKATSKVLMALEQITQEKMEEVKEVKDLASIAKDMSVIVDKLAPSKRESDEKTPQVHVHLYGPHQKKIEDYEVIDV